jgi:hypothetical protein
LPWHKPHPFPLCRLPISIPISLCLNPHPRPPDAQSQGFIGFIAYLGAAAAGTPIAILVQREGWAAFFMLLLSATAAMAALAAPLCRARSAAQRHSARSYAALRDAAAAGPPSPSRVSAVFARTFSV